MQHNMRTFGLTILTCILIASCSKVPSHILSEKEMQLVMKDMLIAESMIGNDYGRYHTDTAKVALYESVFRKYDIDRALYDSSLVWYGRNLDIYMKVYERVIADLNNAITALGDVQASAAPVTNQDSVNIWPRREYLTFQPKDLFRGVVFDIVPEKNYSSGSAFVIGLRVWGLTNSMQNRPEIRLNAVHNDTIISIRKQIDRDGYHEFILRTQAAKQVKQVYGSIRFEDEKRSYYKIFVDSLSLMKYNYGSEALKKYEGEEEEAPAENENSTELDPSTFIPRF
ncbi:DUF4296 domain-containing protein [Parabacteroides sp. PF5-9]|uniref:DUF4296 domain-containing protein n=1 Tax=Parabacteroides sp. PF5-9 TaxID=1742404 RepID=UPI002476AFA7|nr:DUF4296 domain-containing protein [Parabacteroides sp. PF5-9]MDH6357650.1 hypothetical protein [Parabacteroides sp. PF5-9]